MNENPTSKVPVWYWIVAVIALIWNLMGCVNFLMEMFAQEAMMEWMTDVQKEWVRSIPGWIYFLFGIAVATGLAGSICLFPRSKLSVPLFGLSLPVVIVQMVYTMLVLDGLEVMGPSGAVMPVLVIILAIVFLLFAFFAKKKEWLR